MPLTSSPRWYEEAHDIPTFPRVEVSPPGGLQGDAETPAVRITTHTSSPNEPGLCLTSWV